MADPIEQLSPFIPNTSTDSSYIGARAIIAWGVLFIVFIAMTDIPATQPIAAGMAWLLFVAILLKYGPAAFTTLTTVNTVSVPTVKPPGAPAAKKP